MLGKYQIKSLSDRSLRHGKSGSCSIGRIRKHRKTTCLTDFGHSSKICRISEYRCIVHLKVSGVEYCTCRCKYCKRCRIGNRVICLYKLHLEVAKTYTITVFNYMKLCCIINLMLFKFLFNQSTGQPCTVYRYIELL